MGQSLSVDPWTSQMCPLNSRMSSLGQAQPLHRQREKEGKTSISQAYFFQRQFKEGNVGWLDCIVLPRPPHQKEQTFLKWKSQRQVLSEMCCECFFLSWGKTCLTLGFTTHKLSSYFSLMAHISVWLVYAPTHQLRLKRAKFTKH